MVNKELGPNIGWVGRLMRMTIALLLATSFLAALPFQIAQAATITVNTLDDENNSDGDCSLREAIRSANTNSSVDNCVAGSGADTIILPAGTYTLSLTGANENASATGDLDITNNSNVTIQGAGVSSTIIQGAVTEGTASDRVFHVLGNGVLSLENLTVRHGVWTSGPTAFGGGIYVFDDGSLSLNQVEVNDNLASFGGGILNKGTLSISNSTINSNTASSLGGGLYHWQDAGTATANIQSSTISNNAANTTSADGGGGIQNDGGVITITLSTISGNTATNGSAIAGGIYNFAGTSTITATTIANNSATSSGGILNNTGATTTIANSIVADNTASVSDPDCTGILVSGDYNLVENTTGCTLTGSTTNNITGTDPSLGTLANNGGPTQTHSVLTGSAAHEVIPANTNGCKTSIIVDQRGAVRADGANRGDSSCEIGAYEDSTENPTAISLLSLEARPATSPAKNGLLMAAGALTLTGVLAWRRSRKAMGA